MAIGAFGGFLVGLTSIGSGSLIIALLVITVSLTPEKLVGTDVAHAFLLVGAAALAHLFVLNDVDVVLAGKLLVGSIPGRIDWKPTHCLGAATSPASGTGRVAADDGGLAAALALLGLMLGFAVDLSMKSAALADRPVA